MPPTENPKQSSIWFSCVQLIHTPPIGPSSPLLPMVTPPTLSQPFKKYISCQTFQRWSKILVSFSKLSINERVTYTYNHHIISTIFLQKKTKAETTIPSYLPFYPQQCNFFLITASKISQKNEVSGRKELQVTRTLLSVCSLSLCGDGHTVSIQVPI